MQGGNLTTLYQHTGHVLSGYYGVAGCTVAVLRVLCAIRPFVQRTLMSISTVIKKTFPPQSSQPLSRVCSYEKASLTVQPLQLSEFIAAWYSDLVRTQLDRKIKIDK